MTPPRESRNFPLGSWHPLPDRELNTEAAARRRRAEAASDADRHSREIERAEAVDRFSLAPALRYRPDLAANYAGMSDRQLEAFIHDSLAAGRRGERVRYYDALASQFALLQRAPAEQVAALTRQFLSTLEEYSNFLQYAPDLATEERLRFLFAAARIGQTYLSHFRSPPAGAAPPANAEELRSMLAAALDEVDAQLQVYHARLTSESHPALARLEGPMEIVALRRALHRGDRDAQRRHALNLAERLGTRPPDPRDASWQARAERSMLEDPEIVAQLRRFDAPSRLEDRALAVNAHALEWLVLAAASLDRADEQPEEAVRSRYRRFSAVAVALALRHPEWSLEELLRRLRSDAEQDACLADLNQAQLRNAELAGVLTEALAGQDMAGLLTAARETARHLDRLGYGAGRRLLPGILEANRRHHPLLRVEAEVASLPGLTAELGLPATMPGRELLRRRSLGVAQLREYQHRHPETRTGALLRLLDDASAPDPLAGMASELLEAWQGRLGDAADHEVFALHSLFATLEESREGEPLPGELRARAAALRARTGGTEFQTRRMLGHLFSSSNLVALGAGILAAEFLPSLLIARAGAGGSLALRGLPLVARGSLTPWGSALTGVGVGTVLSGLGAGIHNLERRGEGLSTHFWRDFGAGAGINLVTFGLTLPFSRFLQNRLAARAGEEYLLRGGYGARDLAVHGGTVAFAGATALGLGVLGRGIAGGQWSLTGEEVAENVLSIAMWEFGAAGLRSFRGRIAGYEGQLGAHRVARLNELVPALVAREPGLAGQEALLTRLLARGEVRHPGSLERFHRGLAEGRIPRLTLRNQRATLRLTLPEELPARPPAAPEPEPPRPAEPPRPVVIVWERAPLPRLPAATASEAPLSTPTARSEPPGAHPRPIALEESPLRLEVEAQADGDEAGGVLEFSDLAAVPEGGARVLGRGDFRFLSEELRRTVSRAHLELVPGENGEVQVRHLSRGRLWNAEAVGVHGSWYFREDGWHRIPSDAPVALQPGEYVAIGSLEQPVRLRIVPNATPPLSRVSLGPGRRLALGRFRLIRTGEESLFRLAGTGETPIEVVRSLGNEAGERRTYLATDNPVIGEIGEEVFVRIGEGLERRSYRLYLDSPERPASHLPEIDLNYSGEDWRGRFRATSGHLDFGRNHQRRLFTAPFVSRNHFRITIAADGGHPRYVLLVESPNGLAIGGRHYPHGSRLALMSGYYQLAFPMDGQARVFDAPFQMHLPPIEGTFAEWRTGPLHPHHDRAVPPPPPPPPPLPRQPIPAAARPQAHPASTARPPSWRNLWGWFGD